MSYRAWLQAQGKRVPDGTANVYVNYAGRYEVGLRDSSKRLVWYGPFANVAEAKATRDAKRVKRHDGVAEPTNRAMTFGEAAELWDAAHVANLRENTRVTYRAALKHLLPTFGSRRLTTIGRGQIRAYLAEHRDLAGWTLQCHLTVISGVYMFARDDLGVPVPSPPSRGLKRSERPRKAKAGLRILNDAEVGSLLRLAPDDHRLYFHVLAVTGMRKSEALGLTYGDVKAGALHVEAQRDRFTGRRVSLKNDHGQPGPAVRDVTVAPALTQALEARGAQLGASMADFVFADTDYHRVDRAWTKARKAAGLEGVRLHDLRHTHVSERIDAGWTITRVAARIGDTIATVQEVYAHLFDAERYAEQERAEFSERYDAMLAEFR
jgi:integrase